MAVDLRYYANAGSSASSAFFSFSSTPRADALLDVKGHLQGGTSHRPEGCDRIIIHNLEGVLRGSWNSLPSQVFLGMGATLPRCFWSPAPHVVRSFVRCIVSSGNNFLLGQRSASSPVSVATQKGGPKKTGGGPKSETPPPDCVVSA